MTVLAAAAVIAAMLSVPGAGNKVIAVASSVSALNQDDSAQERLQQHRDVLPMLSGQMLGRGLGCPTNPLFLNVGNHISLDSGLIDIVLSFGLPNGMLFLAILAALAFQRLRIALASSDGVAAVEFGGAAFGLAQRPLGSQNTGEHGMFLYLAPGLLLASGVAGAQVRLQPP